MSALKTYGAGYATASDCRLARLAEITGDNNQRNTLRSGGHQGGIKIASELFREEWRNEASGVLRDFWVALKKTEKTCFYS